MKLISREEIEYDIKKKYHYKRYKDKNVEYEESYRDNIYYKACSYTITGVLKTIDQNIDVDKKVDIYTRMYFTFMGKNKTVPTFKKYQANQLNDLYFYINEKPIKVGFKFPEEVYGLSLGNNILILKEMIEDPFDFSDKIYSHYFYSDKGLFIIDYSNNEFYDLDINYHRHISGRLKDKWSIKEYKQDGNNTKFIYDDNGLIDVYSDDKENTFSKYDSKYEKATLTDYFVPYVITTEGICSADKDNRIFCTITYTEDEEDEIISKETSYRYLSNADLNKYGM